MAKIIITENQVRRLKSLLTEERYSQIAPKIETGDKLKIVTNAGDVLYFNVASNFNGHMYLDNLNQGVFKNEVWFLTSTALRDNNLLYGYMNKKNQDTLTKPPNTWPTRTLKNVKEFEVLDDNGNPKYAVDIEQPLGENDIQALIDEYRSMRGGQEWTWTFDDESSMHVRISSVKGKFIIFEVVSVQGTKASNYGILMGRDLEFEAIPKNINIRDSEENYQYEWDIIIDIYMGPAGDKEGSMIKKTAKISDLADMGKKVNFEKLGDDEENEDQIDIESMDDRELAKLIMNDPEMKQAFLSKQTFTDWLLGRNPKGFAPAKRIVSKITDIKNRKKDKDAKAKEESIWNDFKQHEKVWLAFGKSIEAAGLESKYRTNYKGVVTKKGTGRLDDEPYVDIGVEDSNFAIRVKRKIDKNEYMADVSFLDKNGTPHKEKIRVTVKDRY